MITNSDLIKLWIGVRETLIMTAVSLIFAVLFGLALGLILYVSAPNGLRENKVLYRLLSGFVNLFRAIPFMILIFLLIPLTRFLTGSMLGVKAALPPLIIASAPFFARLCLIAFQEIDEGTIEASKAMGADLSGIIRKVVLPESMPAIVSGISVLGISLVGYTAMAGAIGAGGLGNLAYMYGFARHNNVMLYSATVIVIGLVFLIQWIGDRLVRRIDKRK